MTPAEIEDLAKASRASRTKEKKRKNSGAAATVTITGPSRNSKRVRTSKS
jgi:hypothetical protein